MKKSTFKRIKPENFATTVAPFLQEKAYKYANTGILDAWINGEDKEDLVIVVINNEENEVLNDVVTKENTTPCESMYQTFLTHKEARFSK